TPAALIGRGGSPYQRELRGTLNEIVVRAPGWAVEGPVLLLLGEAVAMGGLPDRARAAVA
ncbi:MAG: siroheme synthase CysG, partial [Rubritepida sp.]|nr:siroheme synthase CysG [Rubritepida sp.]